MSEWQPIETAPSGVPVLVTDGLHVTDGIIQDDDHAYSNTPRWNISRGLSPAALKAWMPLPDPPQ